VAFSLFRKMMLPIRSIDFYYPEFQAANVRISRSRKVRGGMCYQ
jgi:hypothetical protein